MQSYNALEGGTPRRQMSLEADRGMQKRGFVYKGRATFRLMGEEKMNEVPCLRYEVGGPARRGVAAAPTPR